jgi:hypothetical protein
MGPYGPTLRLDGTGEFSLTPPSGIHGSANATIAGVVKNYVNASYGAPFVTRNEIALDHYLFEGVPYLKLLKLGRISCTNTVTVTDWNTLSAVHSRSGWTCRQNANVTGTASAEPSVEMPQLVLGTGYAGANWWRGDISALAVWRRALSGEELQAWSADPWVLVRPRTRLIVPFGGAGGGASAIEATAGIASTLTLGTQVASYGALAASAGIASTLTLGTQVASYGALAASAGIASTLAIGAPAASADTATITTAQAGPWGTGSTWVGGVAPGNGDLAVIAHAVTVGDHRICGDSPAAAAGHYALDILEGGSVEITVNGRLTVRGDAMMRYGYAAGSIAGIKVSGGIFEFDSTLAPTPATDGYDFRPTDSNGTLRRLEATAGARIRSVTGAANGRFSYDAGDGQGWNIIATGAVGNPVRFERLGRSADDPAINMLLVGNGWPGQTMVQMTDCVFKECWRLESQAVREQHPFELLRVSHYDSPDTTALRVSVSTPSAPYLHYIEDCTFDKEVYFNVCPGLSVRGCAFAGGWNVAGLPLAEWSGNLATMADYGIIPAAQITDDYWYTPRTHGNVKAVLSSIDTGDCTITRQTVECLNDAVATDGEFFAGLAPVMDITVDECLLIPSHTGHTLRAGEWLNNSTTRITFNHLTAGLINTATFGVGHNGDDGTRTNRGTIKNSLLINFNDTTGSGEKTGYISNDNTDGLIASELDYNCGWGCKDSRYPSTTAKGYRHKQSNTADVPGAHDIDVDPWPDRSTTPSVRRAAMRRLKTWGSTVLGLTGTTAEIEDAAIRAIVVRHDSTATGFVTADATPEALRTWVRDPDGFWGPTNPLLSTAADDGAQVGAIAFSAVTLASSVGIASTLTLGDPVAAYGVLAAAVGIASTMVLGSPAADGGVTGVDMVDSVATVLDAVADLNTAFGSTGWFWHTLAPPRTPVPYVVWRESSGSILGESGGASWLTDSTYSVSVYAATRAEARRLCRAAVDAIEAAADAGSIVFTEGALASLRREAGAFDQLDPDPGEDGADVWEHRIVLRAFVDDQVTVS